MDNTLTLSKIITSDLTDDEKADALEAVGASTPLPSDLAARVAARVHERVNTTRLDRPQATERSSGEITLTEEDPEALALYDSALLTGALADHLELDSAFWAGATSTWAPAPKFEVFISISLEDNELNQPYRSGDLAAAALGAAAYGSERNTAVAKLLYVYAAKASFHACLTRSLWSMVTDSFESMTQATSVPVIRLYKPWVSASRNLLCQSSEVISEPLDDTTDQSMDATSMNHQNSWRAIQRRAPHDRPRKT